jgi:hypothetical protein
MPAIELITLPKLGQKYVPNEALEEEHFAVWVEAVNTKMIINVSLILMNCPPN